MIAAAEVPAEELQMEALLLARTYCYGLFAKLLGATPDEALIDALLGRTASDAFEEFSGNSPELSSFCTLLGQMRASDRGHLLDRARDEHMRVLVGPLALPASPYESPYTGTHDMALFQLNTLNVRAAYEEWGLRLRRQQAVPDDHVSAMCQFASELSSRAASALLGGDADGLARILRGQHAFVRDHMANWLGMFAEIVRNSKAGEQAVLYPQLLEALAAFARADVEFLVESSYWAQREWTGGDARPHAPQLTEAYEALATLNALKPFGIQDFELVSIPSKDGTQVTVNADS